MQDELGEKQFFITPPHTCSYLPNRRATTLFLDPRETVTAEVYHRLTLNGFRRSGSHLYRPHCQNCRACVPTRVSVPDFLPKRRQRRTIKRNRDLVVRVEKARYSQPHYALYARYITARHMDGDMYPPSHEQFRSFLLSPWSDTWFISSYLNDQLVAVAVTDQQPDGLSAIYTFFEPDLAERSLGAFSVLKQLEIAQQANLRYLYLGYWIRDCQKMSYKLDYRPAEVLVNNRWVMMQ